MQIEGPRRWLTFPAIALAALALAACGDDDESSSSSNGDTDTAAAEQAPAEQAGGGEATTLEIDAVEQGQRLSFSKDRLTAKAGEVTVTMRNPAGNQAPHAVEVEGNGVEEVGETVQAGGTSTVTADLEPGKYTFYCPVGDHEDAGMKGTLTVR